MRIGLISDIHAQLDPLIAALTLLHDQGVERVLCAGDLVEKGKQGDSVVSVLRAREIPCVMGNHDEMAVGNQAWLIANGDPSNPNYHARLLHNNTVDFLSTLPFNRRFDLAGRRVFLTHGTPASNSEYLYANSSPDLFRRVAAEADADIVVLGHTHHPMAVTVGDVLVINPGSVSEDGSHTCALLDMDRETFEVFDLATGKPIPEADMRTFRIG